MSHALPTTRTFEGEALLPWIDAVARLRMEVFRTWPYLYEGSLAHEESSLLAYAAKPRSAVTLFFDGGVPVGAATSQPMEDSFASVRDAFTAGGEDPQLYCYFGESVLLPRYRGQGVGLSFFRAREAHALRHGLRHCAFVSVEREADDPRRPADYQPLDGYWTRRGYTERPDIVARMSWREVGQEKESQHTLRAWVKRLP
ncbi:GNAT family N-acetyltransferase [Roseomonas elaeocarpi]|uniref:GNAT family N-acetyltransferase n=1 Tax=Roseomonas elaeocarpi TaxID=907779 RepID=A0ABV6JS14_9PROT